MNEFRDPKDPKASQPVDSTQSLEPKTSETSREATHFEAPVNKQTTPSSDGARTAGEGVSTKQPVAAKKETKDEKSDVLSQLSDKEIAAESAKRWAPSEHEVAGGLDFIPAIFAVLLSLAGLGASLKLVLATLEHAAHPDQALGCDLSAWISCGASMDSWQSHVLGMPNAIIGLIAFSALSVVMVLLLSKVKLPTWFWVAMSVCATAALLFVYWFAWISVFTFKALCPWCLVVWAVMLPLFVIIVGRAARAQFPGLRWLGRSLVRDWWGFLVVMYILLAIIIFAGLGTRLFG
ncbi:hypothetical protein BK816_03800 [Boudabousia tangfeifanii]|uniref:Vitamin K epoxide reductase domain-containing protein n=1 Tax=Boudabousia tangfeifanii TaxID=1912795 RepID=A0A1D9MJR5_9ACTO|nr:vitamin K epoxide reductase family protein [Boudabousia tangfeifanii]AOZ72526.1 hypothetical protein BK816_03800 [Boudabousia tangfeifanii]